MIKGRKESTPSEQLWELRKARDRYNALADRLRDGSELALADQKLEREREARRFAAAYEKSIENMIARCRSRQIETDASTSGSAGIGFALLIFFVAAGGTGYFAFAPTHQNAPASAGHTSSAAAAPASKSPGISPVSLQKPAPDQGAKDQDAKDQGLRDQRARMVPPPISALKPKLGIAKRPDAPQGVRTLQAADRAQYARQQPDNSVHNAVRGSRQTQRDEDGFVAKVLQPDGSLMEQYFPAHAPR
jgi:hypothetical protein